jgi:hypothetical protein
VNAAHSAHVGDAPDRPAARPAPVRRAGEDHAGRGRQARPGPRRAEEGAAGRFDDFEPRRPGGHQPGRPGRDDRGHAAGAGARRRGDRHDQHGHRIANGTRPARGPKPEVDVAQSIEALSSALGISGSDLLDRLTNGERGGETFADAG